MKKNEAGLFEVYLQVCCLIDADSRDQATRQSVESVTRALDYSLLNSEGYAPESHRISGVLRTERVANCELCDCPHSVCGPESVQRLLELWQNLRAGFIKYHHEHTPCGGSATSLTFKSCPLCGADLKKPMPLIAIPATFYDPKDLDFEFDEDGLEVLYQWRPRLVQKHDRDYAQDAQDDGDVSQAARLLDDDFDD